MLTSASAGRPELLLVNLGVVHTFSPSSRHAEDNNLKRDDSSTQAPVDVGNPFAADRIVCHSCKLQGFGTG